MKNKISGLLIPMLILLTADISAQLTRETTKVGTTAAQFLKIGAGARAIALGGAYTALSNDIYAAYYNPAGMAVGNEMAQVTFNHGDWLADMKYDYAAGSFNLSDLGVIFATVTSFSVPEDKVRTFENPEGDGRVWDANSLALGIGYAKKLTDRFSIGFHGKYVHESIWNSSASGFALDVGTLYRTPFNDLMIGASISNFGTKMRLDGRDIQFNYDPNEDPDTGPNNVPANYRTDDFDLPLTFRIGLAMDILKTRFLRLTGALDATHPNDNTEYINSGLEVAYDELLFLRVGYKSLFLRDSEQSLTFGAGLNYRLNDQFGVSVNYGYADYGRLDTVQFFDIGLNF